MVFKSISLAATTLFLSTSVSAAIISTDWQTAGDNLITQITGTDPGSGLEWLDLTATRNRSYNDISSQLSAGGEFEGWRYATRSEVSSFFDAFGGDHDHYNGFSTQNNGLFDSVALYWGDAECAKTTCGPGERFSIFMTAETSESGRHDGGLIFDQATSDIDNTLDYVHLLYTSRKDDYTYIDLAHALVRITEVPAPPALWLFGSGLIGLIGIARRKKS